MGNPRHMRSSTLSPVAHGMQLHRFLIVLGGPRSASPPPVLSLRFNGGRGRRPPQRLLGRLITIVVFSTAHNAPMTTPHPTTPHSIPTFVRHTIFPFLAGATPRFWSIANPPALPTVPKPIAACIAHPCAVCAPVGLKTICPFIFLAGSRGRRPPHLLFFRGGPQPPCATP